MQRVTFKNSNNLTLVGNLFPTSSKSIVILSHALANDKSERGQFDTIATMLNKSGFSVLAFDFSGCGESEDTTLTVGKQVDDLTSALRFVKTLGYTNIGLFGHSLGCLVSLRCYSPEVQAMALWSPITNKVTYKWEDKLSKEQLEELKAKGYYTRTRKNAVRLTYLIDKQMLVDRESVNQVELLKKVTCPVLIIQGTKDESVPVLDSKNAISLLSKDSKLELIEGADHDFTKHFETIVSLTNNWFLKHLKK